MRRFMYKMHPAGFGRTTLKLSDKYKLITRQLLYASLWIRFRWMKSSASFCLLFFILLYSKLILDKVGIIHNCECLLECILLGKSMNRSCRIWHNTFSRWIQLPGILFDMNEFISIKHILRYQYALVISFYPNISKHQIA